MKLPEAVLVSRTRTASSSAVGRPCASTTCSVRVAAASRPTDTGPDIVTPVARVLSITACSSVTVSTALPSSGVEAMAVVMAGRRGSDTRSMPSVTSCGTVGEAWPAAADSTAM